LDLVLDFALLFDPVWSENWILDSRGRLAMKEGDAGMEHRPKSCFDAKSLLVETPVEHN
jgi:hypothetical protein